MKLIISSEALTRGERPDFKAMKYARVHRVKPPVSPSGNGGNIHQKTARGQR